jgi:hypothetical protein
MDEANGTGPEHRPGPMLDGALRVARPHGSPLERHRAHGEHGPSEDEAAIEHMREDVGSMLAAGQWQPGPSGTGQPAGAGA